MAWEKRRNGLLFYYRVYRHRGRVIKEYVGRGAEAERVAKEDEARRAARARQRQAETIRRQECEAAKEQIILLSDEANAVFEAAMVAAGYHRHCRGP